MKNYNECYWLRIPSKILVVSQKNFNTAARRRVTEILMEGQRLFGFKSDDEKDGQFSMFSSEQDASSSLFTPNTVALKPIWPEDSIDKVLGKEYVEVWEKTLQCSACEFQCRILCVLMLVVIYSVICFDFNDIA